jgi:class 3 adenylate cyclase
MTNLRTTVIMKTDIVGSTPRMAGLSEAELATFLNQHRALIGEIVSRHAGTIVRREGDAFWIILPSVTTAVLAAVDMHHGLWITHAGRGEAQRVAIRVVIAVGDVLHTEQDIFGNVLSLVARMEGVTPADEIYLSQAAWLLLNKAEVPTALVNSFTFKGIVDPEPVYKVEQKQRTRVVTGQTIVFTDARGWPSFVQSNPIPEVEEFLLRYDDVIKDICDAQGGTIRQFAGDNYVLTFPDVPHALAAIERLCQQWQRLIPRFQMGLLVGVHQGDIHILRSYVFSHAITVAVLLARLGSQMSPDKRTCAVVTSQNVREAVKHLSWGQKLERWQLEQASEGSAQEQVAAQGAYRFVLDPNA